MPRYGEAIFCQECELWLNSPTQWEDHKIGGKHTKNVERIIEKHDLANRSRIRALASTVVAGSTDKQKKGSSKAGGDGTDTANK